VRSTRMVALANLVIKSRAIARSAETGERSDRASLPTESGWRDAFTSFRWGR
jgi:hypothetical protein